MQRQDQFIPSVSELGRAIATQNDWRAIVVVLAFVIVSLMGFIIWREWNLVRLTRSIDRMTAAMWAMRLALAEDKATNRAAMDRELFQSSGGAQEGQ